jgi:hypothetical protein
METIDVEGTELPTPQKRYVPLLAVDIRNGHVVTISTPTRTSARLDCLETKPRRLTQPAHVFVLEEKTR